VQPPDIVIRNGRVFTSDDARPWAEAVAIRGDRIVAVGTNGELTPLAGRTTRVIDVAGRLVVPGINDAHVHAPWNFSGYRLEIAPDASVDDVLRSVRGAVKSQPEGTLLRGEIPIALLDDPRLTRMVLDDVSPRHPVNLGNFGSHVSLLNTAALGAWSIGETDADPPGGWYGRLGGGLSGWVYEHALWKKENEESERAPDAALVASMRDFATRALRFGITTVQSMPSLSIDRLERLQPQTGVPLRWRWMELQMAAVNESPRRPVKYLFDGTPLERGAALREPYRDRAAARGRMDYTDSQVQRIAEVAARSDQQLLVHAAGDEPLEKLFAAMKRIDADWPAKRVRVEHGDFVAQFLDDARRLGVIVVQNPSHFMLPEIMSARYGAERMRTYMPLRTLIANGVPTALGSDGPINPWLNVLFATMHPTNPAEAISREQAVILYTRGSAYAERAEKHKGTIAPGMLADIAVLSQDIFRVPPPELPKTESVLTIVGGNIAYDGR
jgi:predicted amidohydrolase YtcJ